VLSGVVILRGGGSVLRLDRVFGICDFPGVVQKRAISRAVWLNALSLGVTVVGRPDRGESCCLRYGEFRGRWPWSTEG